MTEWNIALLSRIFLNTHAYLLSSIRNLALVRGEIVTMAI